MLRNTIGLIFVLEVILCFSCQDRRTTQEERVDSNLKIDKVLDYSRISLSDGQSFVVSALFFKDDSLYFYDDKLREIFVYAFREGESSLINTIQVDERVKEKFIGNDYGFSVFDKEILFINRHNIFHLDRQGELIESYNLYKKGFLNSLGGIPLTGTNSPVIKSNESYYTTIYPDIDPFEKDGVNQSFSILKINKSNSAETFLRYPQVYSKKKLGYNYFMNYADHIADLNALVVSFPASDSLYIYDYVKESVRAIPAKSDYLKEIQDWNSPNNDYYEYTRFFQKNSSYSYVKYHPKHKVFFRYAEQGLSDGEIESGQGWKNKHIICLNEEGNFIDTINISNKQLPDMSFMTDEGLIISKFSSEDLLKFDLMKVSPLH